MVSTKLFAVCLAAATVSACATTGYNLTPVQTAAEEIRYDRGFATATSHGEFSSVQVYAAGAEQDRRLAFDVAIMNYGDTPINFGVENVTVVTNGMSLGFYTREELAEEAQRRARNQQVAAVLVGALAAYAAVEAAHSTGTGYYSGPYGVSSWGYSHFNSTAAAIGVGTATAGTALALNEINNSLESALGSLAGQALATTTVDPGFGYGGRAVAQPFDEEMMIDPRVELHVDVGGEIHMFAFTLAEGAANLIPYNSGLSTGGAVGTDTAGK